MYYSQLHSSNNPILTHSIIPIGPNGQRDEPPSVGGGNYIYAIYRANRPSGAKPEGGRLD